MDWNVVKRPVKKIILCWIENHALGPLPRMKDCPGICQSRPNFFLNLSICSMSASYVSGVVSTIRSRLCPVLRLGLLLRLPMNRSSFIGKGLILLFGPTSRFQFLAYLPDCSGRIMLGRHLWVNGARREAPAPPMRTPSPLTNLPFSFEVQWTVSFRRRG
jgi:hypothetical protein